jgi:hypothetical protein
MGIHTYDGIVRHRQAPGAVFAMCGREIDRPESRTLVCTVINNTLLCFISYYYHFNTVYIVREGINRQALPMFKFVSSVYDDPCPS